MTEPRYPYAVVDVPEGDADEAGALLFELGAQGVEERDATTLVRGTVAGRVTLVASFAGEDEASEALQALPPGWSPRIEHVVGEAWRDEWKKHFEPFRICDGIVVRPPWRAYDPGAGERVLVLEPGRAFGTGLHETTRLVAEVLAERAADLAGVDVLDVGCGSGVLSLVALVLGARRARAIDIDADAVATARENAARNGLGVRLDADEAPVQSLTDRWPVVVANIESKALVEMAPALGARVQPGGWLVLSGILSADVAPSQLDDVRQAYRGFDREAVRRDGEWVALILRAAS